MTIVKTDNKAIDIITNDYTDFDGLSLEDQIEYIETDNRIFYAERQKRRYLKEINRKNKLQRNPFYRMAAIVGIV